MAQPITKYLINNAKETQIQWITPPGKSYQQNIVANFDHIKNFRSVFGGESRYSEPLAKSSKQNTGLK